MAKMCQGWQRAPDPPAICCVRKSPVSGIDLCNTLAGYGDECARSRIRSFTSGLTTFSPVYRCELGAQGHGKPWPWGSPPAASTSWCSWHGGYCTESASKLPRERETQIAPVEALAVLQASLLFAPLICHHDIILFIDNQGIASALVRGTSPCSDIAQIVSAIHLVWTVLGTRAWIEYVELEANISDGLTLGQEWILRDVPCVPWHDFASRDLVHLPYAPLHGASQTLGWRE